MGFAVQHHVNVMLPYGKSTPVSLITLVTAPSGAGKSSAMDIAWNKARVLMKTLMPNEEVLSNYQAQDDWWQLHYSSLKKATAKAKHSDDPAVKELNEHLALKPIPPKSPFWLFDDTTPEAILHSMATRWSSVALASAEGGTILQGRAVRHLPQFNQLWSGESVQVDRKTQDPLIIDQGRLSIAIMTQPNSFKAFINNKRELARASGFLARALICQVDTIHSPVTGQYAPSLWFDERMESLLTLAFKQSEIAHKELYFSESAKEMWQNYVNQIKQNASNKYYPLHELGDLVAKVPEQIGRIAAVLTCFESNNQEAVIDHYAMETALGLMGFYINEAIRIYHPQADEVMDAQLLWEWFEREIQKFKSNQISRLQASYNISPYFNPQTETYYIDKSQLYHYVTRQLRNKYKLESALDFLENQGLIRRSFQNNTQWIHIIKQANTIPHLTLPPANPY